MDIHLNTNTAALGAVPFPPADSIDGAGRAGRVDGTTDSVRLTAAASAAAHVASVRSAIPDDLERPADVDVAAINSLCAKLESGDGLKLTDAEQQEIVQDVSKQVADATAGLDASTGSTKVMFDLYKLMALLVEVAQEQRDAARDLRSAASAQIQNAVLAQARQQRSAALTGMIAGAICCAIQVGFSVGSLVKTAKAFNTQLSTMGESGVTSARQNLSTLENARTSDSARKQLQKVENAVGNDVVNDVKQGFGEAVRPNRADQGGDGIELENLNPDGVVNEALPENANAQTARAKGEFERTRQRQVEGAELTNEQIEEINTARTNLRTAIKADLQGFEDAVVDAKSQLANAGPGADLADLKKNVTAAEKRLTYARAYAASELAKDGVTLPAEHMQDIKDAAARVTAAQESLAQNPAYMKASYAFQRGEAYNGLTTTIGTCVQNVIQNVTQLQQAKATEQGALQQQSQENLDQMKDFFAAAGDLMNQVIQLMNAVGSAEAQSMRDAIQA